MKPDACLACSPGVTCTVARENPQKQPKPVGTAAWHSDPLDFTHLHPSPSKWNLERRVAATNSAVVAAVD